MEKDIKVLEDMRDNIYGAIQFEDDYEVRALEQKQFDALNLAINHLRKTKLVHSQFIPKSKVRDKINKLGTYREKHFYFRKDLSKAQHDKSMKMLGGIKYLQELLQEGDDK